MDQDKGASPDGDRAVAASPSSPSVPPLRASIPSAEDALRALIEAVAAESGASKELYHQAVAARRSLAPDPDEPLESATFFYSDYGSLGIVRIDLPRVNGGDEQFDADFNATLEFVKGVLGRRKVARAQAIEARRAETGTGSVERSEIEPGPATQDAPNSFQNGNSSKDYLHDE